MCKDSWDADFIDKIGKDRQNLYDLILAANYMDIKGLLHLGCAKVASLIKGQPLEKLSEGHVVCVVEVHVVKVL